MTENVTRDKEILAMFPPKGIAYKVVRDTALGWRPVVSGKHIYRVGQKEPAIYKANPLAGFHCFRELADAKWYLEYLDVFGVSYCKVIAVEYEDIMGVGDYKGRGVLLTKYVTPMAMVPIAAPEAVHELEPVAA